MKAKELTTVAQSRRDSAFSQDMWQAGCEEAVERGTEKNVVQNARYLHGDPPADRHLARDEAILIINPLSVMWGEKHITTGTRSPLRSPFGSATGLLDPQKSLRDKSSSLNELLSGTLRNANLFLTSLNFQLTTLCYRCCKKIFA